jgi:predicted MFS family arabinose efflux permease
VVSGVALARLIARAPARALVVVDSAWRAACLAAIVALVSAGGLSLLGYVCLLAAASVTRPAGMAGERALVKALVSRDTLLRANALTATSYQVAAVVGPLVGGAASSLAGPEYVLLVDAATFAAFALVAAGLPVARAPADEDEVQPALVPHAGARLGRPLATIFTLTFAFFLLYGPTVVALPLHARSMASGLGVSGALMLSLLWTAFGLGGALGALLGGRRPQRGLLRAAVVIVGLWGIATVGLGLTHVGVLGLIAMAVGGASYAPYPALTATILQRETRSERELLRVGSLWASMTSAAAPLGMLAGAAIVPALGAGAALTATGAAMVAICLLAFTLLRSGLRPRAST